MSTTPESDAAYDVVAWPGSADSHLNLRHVDAVGSLFGHHFGDLSGLRVLEIGCAAGVNLIAQAEAFPGVQFIGLDRASRQIESGRSAIDTLAISNVELRCADLRDVDAGWGSFDLILCPGVYAWVSDDEREKLLRICRDRLAPEGIAAVSWNARPGWNSLQTVRDAMQLRAMRFPDPERQIAEARAAVEFFAEQCPDDSIQGRVFRTEREFVRRATDEVIYHDYLTSANRPVCFHEFHQAASDHGLQYLAEANFVKMAAFEIDRAQREQTERLPLADREQMLDFLRNETFRKSLLCHGGVNPTRRLNHETIAELHLALTEPLDIDAINPPDADALEVPCPAGTFSVRDPAGIAAIRHLATIRPSTIQGSQLCDLAFKSTVEHARESLTSIDPDQVHIRVGQALLTAFCSGAVVGFRHRPNAANSISDRPTASAAVRYYATRLHSVPDLWHRPVSLNEFDRRLLALLDGRRDITSLAAALDDDAASENTVNESLNRLYQHVLLCG